VVLDPFMGAGSTAVAAVQHHRDFLGIELNPEYRALALARIREARHATLEQVAA
jgi:DNA modification methylase